MSKFNLQSLITPHSASQVGAESTGQNSPGRNSDAGSSMIELLIAAVVALFAASAAAQLITNLTQSGFNRRSAATSAIEVSITNDLSWLRQYSVLWRMIKGPYISLPVAMTGGDSYQQIANATDPNAYLPKPSECGTVNMANQFLQDASNPSTYISPLQAPPNQVSNNAGEQSISLPSTASEYTLYRKLQAGSIPGTVKITYIVKNSAGAPLYSRPSTLYLPAAGWCS